MALHNNPDFIAFVANRSFNAMGMHAFTVAIGWHVYQLTGDPLDLGLIGLAQFAPVLVLFLVAGVAADRFDRRAILVLCNGVQFLCVAAVAWVLLRDTQNMALILAILSVHGAARGFYHPASQAILPNLVPAAELSNAVAFSSSANKAAQLIGPAVGGALIAWIGDGVYAVIMGCFALSGLTGLFLRKGMRVRGALPFNIRNILGGFDYVWRNKIVLGAISIDLLAVLFGGVMSLLPVYASDILHVGPAELGLMRAMPAIGSLVVGLCLSLLSAPRHMGTWLFVSLAIFGMSILTFGLSETFWISIVALAVYGGADMVSVYVRQTLVQIATPDGMRGRVSAVNSVSINASNELGDFRAGAMAAVVGTIPAVVVGGLATLVVTAVWCAIFPTIRTVDRLSDISKPDQSG